MSRVFRIITLVLLFRPVLSWTEYNTRDSTFWSLSLPELQSAVNYYQIEIDALGEEKRNLIRRGIEDSERLLLTRPDPKIIDQILIRLADLYYYQAKDDYFTRMEAFESQTQGSVAGGVEPRLDFSQALSMYQRILDEFPQSEYVDDAVYNKGYLFEEMGDFEKANQIYLHLIDSYPQSPFVSEAYMRLGENAFNPPKNDLNRAISCYQKVINDKNSSHYNEALYKLGWSYYRLSEYPQAITYFTNLVEIGDTLANTEKNDLVAEAVEYIAICFIDFGGPSKAVEYILNIGNPVWGWGMLERLGDIYFGQKEEYQLAIKSYEALIPLLPTSMKPPVQKKIVDCYRILNDEPNLLLARQKLVADYGPASTWWKSELDEKTKLTAYRLAEEALREMINTFTLNAKKTESRDFYEMVVQKAHDYLDLFPEDTYAYMVRWNLALILDTKLARYKDALQEYLTISMVYHNELYIQFAREKGLPGIQDAAENAIVVADSLIQIENQLIANSNKPIPENQSVIPLSSAESWLAMAYDNYIKLFPYNRQTASILMNAGALYFSHQQFNEALKYFKTLVKHFPNSLEMQQAQLAVLESYFVKKDYNSAEVLAKKIISEAQSPEIKLKAQRRKAESIFLHAQTLASAGRFNAAADEYLRMALEAPESEIADKALFNAGKAYDQARQYPSAIQAYERLISSYTGSSLLTDALNNSAFDYGETGNFARAAERYELLTEKVKTVDSVRNARFNVWVFWNKAQNWPLAIRAGERYITNYSESPDAESIGFKAGEFHLLNGDTVGAIRTYANFPYRFQNSRFGVTALFKAAQLQEARNGAIEADSLYWAAYQFHQTLANRGIAANDMDAAEALYRSTRNLHNRFDSIEFTDPSIVAQIEIELKDVLQRLIEQYGRIIAFRTIRVPESLYQIGRLYEHHATAWNKQVLPPLDLNNRVVMEKAVHEKASRIYGQSQAAYGKAVDALKKIIQETSLGTTGSDSLLADAKLWLARSEDKISETQYRIAEINSQSVYELLTAPMPEDLTVIPRLDYQSQLLTKVIQPILDVIVGAHWNNLRIADSLMISNQWTQASQVKILAALRLMAQKFSNLSFDALSGYGRQSKNYHQLENSREAFSQEGIDEMMHCLDLVSTYAQSALNWYVNGIKRGKSYGIPDSSIQKIQTEKKRFAISVTDSITSYSKAALIDQQNADFQFKTTQDPRYEEKLGIFEDQVYFLAKGYTTILETSIESDSDTQSFEDFQIHMKLAKINPDLYLSKYGFFKTQMIVNTDSTWWCPISQNTRSQNPGDANTGTHPAFEPTNSQIAGVFRIKAELDQDRQGYTLSKDFTIPGFPISGKLQLFNGLSGILLNGVDWKGDSTSIGVQYFLDRGVNHIALFQNKPFWAEGRILIDYIQEKEMTQ